jgi:tryptophanase
MRTIIEPFRTKVVEPIYFTTPAQRRIFLKEAGYNLFKIAARDVVIDLLTDSGTSAMSQNQWSGLMRGDESYAGCASFFRFEQAVQEIFGYPIVIPVHQGRAAERLLFGEIVRPGHVVPSNTHFDTTRANIEILGGQAVDMPCPESLDSTSSQPFKGNLNIETLEALLKKQADSVPFIMITITNNAAGGQPVSLENISAVSRLAKTYGKALYIDAARFAENSYLIQTREVGMESQSVRSIAGEIFALADGCLMSAKKDGLANMGGFIALRDEGLANAVKNKLIVTEGFPTYGGLSGRDLETIAIGLQEVLDEDYLKYRLASATYLADGLRQAGIPLVLPAGLHAVYVDARRMFPHSAPGEFPGQALVCELYLEAGIRSCEIGTAMFGQTLPDGRQRIAAHDLVRLALPRRVYNQSHYDYVIEAAGLVYARRHSVAGMRITSEPPQLRHFTASFEPLPARQAVSVGNDVAAVVCGPAAGARKPLIRT